MSLKNDSDLEDGIDIDLWDMFARFERAGTVFGSSPSIDL
jgi:hypothetical protein